MFKPRFLQKALVATLASVTLCIAGFQVSGQKTEATDGAPLEGAVVILARYGGMQFGGGMTSLRATTKKDGTFTFPVVPEGSYYLMINPPDPENTSAATRWGNGMSKSVISNIRARITINGTLGGTIKTGWNFESGKSFDPAATSTAKNSSAVADKIDVKSDGHNLLHGTIVRAISNPTK